jgi:hypothetical protein
MKSNLFPTCPSNRYLLDYDCSLLQPRSLASCEPHTMLGNLQSNFSLYNTESQVWSEFKEEQSIAPKDVNPKWQYSTESSWSLTQQAEMCTP